MVRLVGAISDRVLGMIVPRVTAAAATCSPNSSWWTSYCYCSGERPYYTRCVCDSTGNKYTCTCTYRAGIGTC